MTIETFRKEIAEAIKAFDKYVVCLGKSPEDFEKSLASLVQKAIKAYESRGPNLRHGIALDKQVTVILSQGDGPNPADPSSHDRNDLRGFPAPGQGR